MADEERTPRFCREHTQLVEKIGGLRSDTKAIRREQDTFRTQVLSSFRDAALKADERHREIRGALNGKLKELKFEEDEKTGEFQAAHAEVAKKVEGLEKWRYALYLAGIVLLFLLSPLVGKFWDLVLSIFK